MPMDFKVDAHLNWLELKSVECCGWIQVSNFMSQDEDEGEDEEVVEDLRTISEKPCIIPNEVWSQVMGKPTQFTMYCVLIDHQVEVYGDLLLELGWQSLPSFLNPNTKNRCNPYMFIPKGLE